MTKRKLKQGKWEKVLDKPEVHINTLTWGTDETLEVLDYCPIILTKDKEWLKQFTELKLEKPRKIILLPPDALLVKPQDA